MKECNINKFIHDNPTIVIIESLAKGLHYLFDNDKSRFAVSATGDTYKDNGCVVTVERAQEIASQIKKDGKLPTFDRRHFVFSGTHGKVVLNEAQAEAFCAEFEDMIDFREASSGVKYELVTKKEVIA